MEQELNKKISLYRTLEDLSAFFSHLRFIINDQYQKGLILKYLSCIYRYDTFDLRGYDELFVLFIPFFVFWILVTFGNEVIKICNLCLHFARQDGQDGKKIMQIK